MTTTDGEVTVLWSVHVDETRADERRYRALCLWLREQLVATRGSYQIDVVLADGHALRVHYYQADQDGNYLVNTDGEIPRVARWARLRSYPPGYDGPRA